MRKLLLILLITINMVTFAKEIYIGDIIRLNIDNDTISEKEVREKFLDFEIVELKKSSDGYNIAIRKFEPGISEIRIGNKLVKIELKSTLDKYNKENIFLENEANEPKLLNPNYPFPITYVAIIIVTIIIIIMVIFLLKLMKKGKTEKKIDPYREFLNSLKSIEYSEDFYEITNCFKKYIHDRFQININGKSETDLIEVSPLSEINDYKEWANDIKKSKFSGLTLNPDEKRDYKDNIIKIVNLLEDERKRTEVE